MDAMSTGAGLGALGFWLFIAAIIAVGVWSSIRKRESQHETIRRAIESGQDIDPELADKLLTLTGTGSKELDRDLKVSGWIVLFLAPGMVLLGYGLSMVEEGIFPILLGVSGLMVFLSIGMFVAAYVVKRWYSSDVDSAGNSV
jgi:membrane protein implicated in regulation of membrane protease activity